MATTIIIEGKKVTGTVTEKEVVANVNLLNYLTSKYTSTSTLTSNTPEAAVNIKTIGMDENAVPTNIRFRSEWSQAKTIDLFTRIVNYKRAFIDQINTIDQFTRIVNYNRIVPETVVVQENKLFTIRSLKSDLINAGENTIKTVSAVRTDQANAGEFILKLAKSNLADTISVLEKTQLTPKIVKTDEAKSTDSFIRFLSWYRTFAETIAATDDYLGNANIDDDQYASFIKAILVSVQITEFIAKQIRLLKSETINLADGKNLNIGINKADYINASDSFSRVVAYNFAQLKQVNAAETVLKTTKKLTLDTINITELNFSSIQLSKSNFISYPTETIAKNIRSVYIDNNSILEFIAKNTTTIYADSINVTDNVTKVYSLLKLNSTTIQDNFSRTVAYFSTLLDQINVTDDYLGNANIDDDQYVTFGKRAIDTVNVLETLAKSIAIRINTDVTSILENKFFNIILFKTNRVTVTDTQLKNINLASSNLVNTESIFTRTTNYFRTVEQEGIFNYLVLETLSDYLLLETGDFLTTEISKADTNVTDKISIVRAIF
jgi:hypothetical protein